MLARQADECSLRYVHASNYIEYLGTQAHAVLRDREIISAARRVHPSRSGFAAQTLQSLFHMEEKIFGLAIVRNTRELRPIQRFQRKNAFSSDLFGDDCLARKHQSVRVLDFKQRIEEAPLGVAKVYG
jgi:hypothetical protein